MALMFLPWVSHECETPGKLNEGDYVRSDLEGGQLVGGQWRIGAGRIGVIT